MVVFMSNNQKKILFYGLAILPALLLFLWLWRFDFDLLDDAYIPMTYARNIAAGHGIVFYPGGERIEGFTSPAWTAWLTLWALGGASLPWVAKSTSLAFSLAVVYLCACVYRKFYYTSKKVAGEPPEGLAAIAWPLAAGLALVSDVSLAAYSVSGMEAAAYSFALLLLAFLVIQRCADWAVCLMMLIVSLTRPEGPAFWSICLAFWIFQRKLTKSRILLFFLIVIVPYCAFIGFRMLYFGQPLPNTFYAKHNFGGWELVRRGVEYIRYFFQPRPLVVFAFLGLLIETKERRSVSLWFFAFALLHVAIVTFEGGDHFTLHRFMIPSLAFFWILSVRGISLCAGRLIQERFGQWQGARKVAVHVVLAAIVLVVINEQRKELVEYSVNTRCQFAQGTRYHVSVVKWTRSWVKVGEWMKEKYPPDTLIAVCNAGAIPFYSELPCIDMLGLNDRTIAHTPTKYESLCYPGHDRSNSGYVLDRKPKHIQLFPLLFSTANPYPVIKVEDMINYPAQMDMWQEKRFHEQYDYKTEETSFGFISYFERRNDVDG